MTSEGGGESEKRKEIAQSQHPTPEEIERYGLEKVELWLSTNERFRVMSTYYRELELRRRSEKC